MREKKKLYVDAKLRVVHDASKAVAIVNLLNEQQLQVMFLEPIAHNLSLKSSADACRKWIAKNYPKFRNKGTVILPTPEICRIANSNEDQIKIHSCHTSRFMIDNQKHLTYRVFINEKGFTDFGWGKKENVYATLIIYKDRFESINKNINFDDYLLLMPKRNPQKKSGY